MRTTCLGGILGPAAGRAPRSPARRRSPRWLALWLTATWLAGMWAPIIAEAADSAPASVSKKPDVVYVPTPQVVVDRMLELAEIKPGDVVYDLGCGDARILVTAAKKYGVKGVGFDIDPQRILDSLANVKSNRVEHLVTIKQADIFTLDLKDADVVTLYLLPELNVRLMPQLAKLKPGSRIVSHDFGMSGAKPVLVHTVKVSAADNGVGIGPEEHTIYKWIVPWEKGPAYD